MQMRMVLLVHAEFTIILLVDGVGANLVGAVESDAGVDTFIYCARENKAPVVVSMFANKVDAAR